MKKTVYLIASHEVQGTDFEVHYATTSYADFYAKLSEYEPEEFDEEYFVKKHHQELVCDMGLRYFAAAADVEIPEDHKVYGLFVNANDMCWEGELLGMYANRERAETDMAKGKEEYDFTYYFSIVGFDVEA